MSELSSLTDRLRRSLRENGEKDETIDKLTEALENIANPLTRLQKQAARDGHHLSAMAISIANDPETLKGIAHAALAQTTEIKEPK